VTRSDVVLGRKEDKSAALSFQGKGCKVKLWDQIEKSFRKQKYHQRQNHSLVKGGLCVDIGVQAFLPGLSRFATVRD